MTKTYTPSQDEVVALMREKERQLNERIAIACRQPASLDTLYALAHAPALAMSDAGALIQGGRMPSPYREDRIPEVLMEYETEVALLKRAVASGEITFPCRQIELVLWAETYKLELPEFFIREVTSDTVNASNSPGANSARDTLKKLLRNVPRKTEKPRANSKQFMLARVKNGLEEIEQCAKDAGILLKRSALPGNSKPYIAILRDLEPALKGRSDGTLKDDLAGMGCKWKQGATSAEADPILDLFFSPP